MKIRFLLLMFWVVFVSTAQIKNDSVYAQVDKLAEYPEGMEKFYEFVRENFKYPNLSEDIEGTVVVSFIIEKDRKVSNINILKGVENTVDAEVAKIVQMSSGSWIPAEKQGETVRFRYTVPVKIIVPKQNLPAQFDKRADYKGGMEQFQKEFVSNLKISNRPKEKDKGMFIIDFDVDIDGKISNIAVTKNTTEKSDDKIIEAFMLSKSWVPALQKGKPVKSRLSIPVVYTKDKLENTPKKNNVKWGK